MAQFRANVSFRGMRAGESVIIPDDQADLWERAIAKGWLTPETPVGGNPPTGDAEGSGGEPAADDPNDAAVAGADDLTTGDGEGEGA